MTTPQTDAPTLQERLRNFDCITMNGCGECLRAEAADALDAHEATIAALVAGLESALERLNTSLFENSEHAQAKDVIRAALAKAAAPK